MEAQRASYLPKIVWAQKGRSGLWIEAICLEPVGKELISMPGWGNLWKKKIKYTIHSSSTGKHDGKENGIGEAREDVERYNCL